MQKLLARDKTIVVSCWLQTLDEERAQEGTRQITHLPITKEDLFYYDVIMLFDPESAGVRSGLDRAAQAVRRRALRRPAVHGRAEALRPLAHERPHRGTGEAAAGQLRRRRRAGSRGAPFDESAGLAAEGGAGQRRPSGDAVLSRAAGDAAAAGKRCPAFSGASPRKDAKPTAQVLLEHSDPTLRSVEGSRPLLVAGRYGSGHTLYLGFNGTWRWRQAGRQAEFFDKFWIQAVRYLVEGRSLEGRRRGYVQTDRDRYEIGEKVTITARLQDATYNPLIAAEGRRDAASRRRHAGNRAADPGRQPAGRLRGDDPGRRRPACTSLRINLPASDAEGGLIETTFTVELPSVETNQVWLEQAAAHGPGQRSPAASTSTSTSSISSPPPCPTRPKPSKSAASPTRCGTSAACCSPSSACSACEWFVRKRYKLL